MGNKKTIKSFKSVVTFEINNNNHVREIVTYSDNAKGRSLRNKHSLIESKMQKLPTSPYSFAYKENSCTRKALTVHQDSVMFIKLDIHDYFNSITLDNLLKLYGTILHKNKITEEELDSCFFNNHLPLGFITSPKISDLYLYFFDEQVSKFVNEYPTLKYSRYCDDILISINNNDFALLHKFEAFLRKELAEFGLKINDSKRREFDLEKDTAVTFLGLNLSKKDGKPRITISKGFLLWTLDLIAKYKNAKTELNELYNKQLSNLKEVDLEEKKIIKAKIKKANARIKSLRNVVLSRIAYIKYNSEVSFIRFKNKYHNKFSEDWNRECLY